MQLQPRLTLRCTYLCSLMEYQVSRNRERAHWIDGYYVERESLADFADKVEHIEQIYSSVQFRVTEFQFEKIC